MSAAGSDTLLTKHNKHYAYIPYCLQAANWVILLSQVSTTSTPKPHLIEISDNLQKAELYESHYTTYWKKQMYGISKKNIVLFYKPLRLILSLETQGIFLLFYFPYEL